MERKLTVKKRELILSVLKKEISKNPTNLSESFVTTSDIIRNEHNLKCSPSTVQTLYYTVFRPVTTFFTIVTDDIAISNTKNTPRDLNAEE